jgi:hypothetical protein
MIIVPVRNIKDCDGGLTCLMGSEPKPDAEREFLPKECVANRVDSELGGLSVLILDESRLPDGIRKALGLGPTAPG